jgi:Uma2 family endonuclease
MALLIETPVSAPHALVDFISAEEYLLRERSLPKAEKHEYLNGKIIKMGGAREKHNAIVGNLQGELYLFLKGKGYRIYNSDMRVHNPLANGYFYPDITVVKGQPLLKDKEFDNLLNPVLIVEVLSKSTEAYDREDKFTAYQSILSLQEYVLVSSEEVRVEYFRKRSASQWEKQLFTQPAEALPLLNGDAPVTLADIYQGVDP